MLYLLLILFCGISICYGTDQMIVSNYYNRLWRNSSGKLSLKNWFSVSCNSNCSNMFAVVNGGSVYRSVNSGDSWLSTSLPTSNWTSISSSSVGDRVAVASSSGLIYLSDNYGATWTNIEVHAHKKWRGISMDNSGQYLTAIAYTDTNKNTEDTGGVYTTQDYGFTWTQTKLPLDLSWFSVDMSGNGSVIIAVAYGNGIYLSSDYGTNWNIVESEHVLCTAVTIDDSGKHIAAVEYLGTIHTSDDSGTTWKTVDTLPRQKEWITIDSDSTGQYLVAGITASSRGGIFLSNDFGSSWQQSSAPDDIFWQQVAMSNDGQQVVSVGANSGIFATNSETIIETMTPTFSPSITPTISRTKSGSSGSSTISHGAPSTAYIVIILISLIIATCCVMRLRKRERRNSLVPALVTFNNEQELTRYSIADAEYAANSANRYYDIDPSLIMIEMPIKQKDTLASSFNEEEQRSDLENGDATHDSGSNMHSIEIERK